MPDTKQEIELDVDKIQLRVKLANRERDLSEAQATIMALQTQIRLLKSLSRGLAGEGGENAGI